MLLTTQKQTINKRIIYLLVGVATILTTFYYLQISEAGGGGYASMPTVHLFSQDTAPADGDIRVFVNYGEENRPEGNMLAEFRVEEGQHMDQDEKLTAMRYARVWYRPDGSDDWYLLPSQYWHNEGSCKDEFGVSPRNNHPSYHTFFENMIHQDDVPHLTRLDECPFGSSHYCPQAAAIDAPTGGNSEPAPTATVIPTPTPIPPTPTLCVVLRQGGHSPCSGSGS